MRIQQRNLVFLFFLGFVLCLPSLASASGGIAEFASPLQQFLDTLKGPLAKVVLTLMLIITGIAYYFTQGEQIGGVLKVLVGVILCMTIVAFATSIVDALFPGVSGALL